MNRDTARTVFVALLCVLAIGFAAATLNSTVSSSGGGGGFAGMGNVSPIDVNISSPPDNVSAENISRGGGGERGIPDLCIGPLENPGFYGGIALVTFGGLALVYRRYDGTVALTTFAAVLPLYVILYAVFTACGNTLQRQSPPAIGGNVTALNRTGGGGILEFVTSPSVTAVVFGALGLALVLVYLGLGSDDRPPADEGEEEGVDEDALDAIGRAAGSAADRIEAQADVDNEVYRAWKEMTGHLEVERPRSSTPGEFAAAATAAGMDEDDVAELTRLFEEVRYGGRDPADREGSAVEALRRIEATYADTEDET